MPQQNKSMFDMDFTKYMTDFKMPGFDVDALMATQRKNLEAITAANQRALEGFGAITRRQSEMARETVETYSRAFGGLTADGSPEERLARQADVMKDAFEQGVTNFRELADIATKTSDEAMGLIGDRVTASFDEAKTILQQSGAPKAKPAAANTTAKSAS